MAITHCHEERKVLADVQKIKVTTKILLLTVFCFLAQHLPLNVLPLGIIYLGTKIDLNYI
jgi:hypothetical protein